MASGVIYGTTSNKNIEAKIEWSAYPYNQGNYSYGSAQLYYRKNSGTPTYGTGDFSITIDGKTTTATYVWLDLTAGSGWHRAANATFEVPHNADGTKKVVIQAEGSIDGTTLDYTTCGEQVTLDTIPRDSTITSAYKTNLGSPCKVTWTPCVASYYYKLKFYCGEWSHTTDAFCPGTTSLYTYTGYDIPYEVAEQFPSSRDGVMNVTLYTYSDNGVTQVGSQSSKTFTVALPDNSDTKPKVTMSLTPDSSLGDKFAGVYIQGLSKVKATTLTAEGKYGADIDSLSLSVLGKSYTSPYQSEYLNTSGTVTVTGTATDSRGYSNTTKKDITVISYSKPKLLPVSGESNIICARCDKSGNLDESGTYLKIRAMRSYSKITADGVQKNLCSIRYRYVTEGNKFDGDKGWVTLLAGETTSTDTVSEVISGVVSSAVTSYVVQVGVIDDIGYDAVVQFVVPTSFVTIDVPESHKGKRIGMFRYAENAEQDGLYLGLPLFGGSVDSLKLGTPLLATEFSPISLNDVKTPGCYYSYDKATTQYISDAPSNVDFGFGLEVREMQSVDNIRQTLYYGITSWYRHWNGHEWSAWVSSLTGVSAEVIAQDFVVDIGTSGLWKYRLWQSGEAELWGVITLSTFGDVRHIYLNAGLPFPFTEYPTVTMTLSQAVAYEYTQGAIVLSEVYTVGASTIKLMMIRNEGGLTSGNTAKVSVVINGKWK